MQHQQTHECPTINPISRNSSKPRTLKRTTEMMGRRKRGRFDKLHLDELLDLRVRKQESCSWKLYEPAEYFISSKGADLKKNQLSLEIHSCVNRKPLPSGERCLECAPQRVIRRLIMESVGYDIILWLLALGSVSIWLHKIRQAARARHSPASVRCLHVCLRVSCGESPTPQDCCRGRAARGKVPVPLPLRSAGPSVCCPCLAQRASSRQPHPVSYFWGCPVTSLRCSA